MKNQLKSSPYVYPYVPFNNLNDKKIKYKIKGEQGVTWQGIFGYLNKIEYPIPKITGKSIAEKILDIFVDPNYLFGPKEYVLSIKDNWLEKINYFINQNKPILFTILGFPFKVPVPLKTNRIFPDMGDVLALNRLHKMNLLIKNIYSPGSIIYVFTEGPFGKFTDVPKKRIDGYMKFLQELVNKLGYNNDVKLIDIGILEKEKGFKSKYQKEIKVISSKFKSKDREYMKKFKGTSSSLYRIVGTEKYSEEILMDVYNDNLPNSKCSPQVVKIRNYLAKKTESAVIKYHAYLNVRDQFDFINKTVPRSLQLSVSPKPYRLGIQPIDKNNIRIPHHAITVFNPKTNTFTLEYLIDLKRTPKNYTEVHLESDKDPSPFFYIEN